ncbi:hypothetical protein C0J52_00563 [Blattella germanica]|nr:hypothetical protein C0J52_00563 [Blattella germanica]
MAMMTRPKVRATSTWFALGFSTCSFSGVTYSGVSFVQAMQLAHPYFVLGNLQIIGMEGTRNSSVFDSLKFFPFYPSALI